VIGDAHILSSIGEIDFPYVLDVMGEELSNLLVHQVVDLETIVEGYSYDISARVKGYRD
jgi:hypothetical protein